MKYYKVTNYFGGISEVFDTYEEARKLFQERMDKKDEHVELIEITSDNHGYSGHGIEYFRKGRYYTA